jgi:hypothetical protein
MSNSTTELLPAAFHVRAAWSPPIVRSELISVVNIEFNRTVVPELDDTIIFLPWEEKIAKAKADAAGNGISAPAKLFNGTKFRLADVHTDTATTISTRAVRLCLGITDYRTSLGCCEGISRYEQFAAATNAPLKSLLSQALGVEALLVTADDHCVLFRRSQHVAEMAGWYCCPGGHPEPKNILRKEASASMTLDEQANWFQHVASSVISREIFDACVDEVVAELGIAPTALRHCGLVGIIEHAGTRKPDVISVVRTTLTADKVAQQFNRRDAEETFESDEGSCVLVKLTPSGVTEAVGKHRITPASLACLELGMKALACE